MAETKTDGDRRVGVLIHLPCSLIERLRADAQRAGLSLSREIEQLATANNLSVTERKEAS